MTVGTSENVGTLESEGAVETEGLLLGVEEGPDDGIILGGWVGDGVSAGVKLPMISFSTLAQNFSSFKTIFCLFDAKVTCRLVTAKRRRIG